MDASDLKNFEAVVRLGSMSRASEELHTVQSNVTARIRALEEERGIALFHRTNRCVTPTPAGQRLLPYAAGVDACLTVSWLEREIRDFSGYLAQRLSRPPVSRRATDP